MWPRLRPVRRALRAAMWTGASDVRHREARAGQYGIDVEAGVIFLFEKKVGHMQCGEISGGTNNYMLP